MPKSALFEVSAPRGTSSAVKTVSLDEEEEKDTEGKTETTEEESDSEDEEGKGAEPRAKSSKSRAGSVQTARLPAKPRLTKFAEYRLKDEPTTPSMAKQAKAGKAGRGKRSKLLSLQATTALPAAPSKADQAEDRLFMSRTGPAPRSPRRSKVGTLSGRPPSCPCSAGQRAEEAQELCAGTRRLLLQPAAQEVDQVARRRVQGVIRLLCPALSWPMK